MAGGRERLYEQVSARIWRNWSLTVHVDVVSSHMNETQTHPTVPALQPSTVHIQPKALSRREAIWRICTTEYYSAFKGRSYHTAM